MNNDIHTALDKLFKIHQKALKSIAAKTGNEYSPEDVQNEAWVLALEMQSEGNISFDNLITSSPETFFEILRRKLSKRWDGKLRYAKKLDHPLTVGDGNARMTLQDTIADEQELGPLEQLVKQETRQKAASQQNFLITKLKGSLAHAYTQLLDEFGDFKELATYLRISTGQCRKHYNAAVQLAQYQHHLPLTTRHRKIRKLYKPWRRFQTRRKTQLLHSDSRPITPELFS